MFSYPLSFLFFYLPNSSTLRKLLQIQHPLPPFMHSVLAQTSSPSCVVTTWWFHACPILRLSFLSFFSTCYLIFYLHLLSLSFLFNFPSLFLYSSLHLVFPLSSLPHRSFILFLLLAQLSQERLSQLGGKQETCKVLWGHWEYLVPWGWRVKSCAGFSWP